MALSMSLMPYTSFVVHVTAQGRSVKTERETR